VTVLANLRPAEDEVGSVDVVPAPDDDDLAEPGDAADSGGGADGGAGARRRLLRRPVFVYGMAALLVLAPALGASVLKYWDSSARNSQIARTESVEAARESVVAMLSYQPENVEGQLAAAQDRLTGEFRDSYAGLTRDVVIPGAKQKRISTVANVPAAASVSATPDHAVVLVFVNQSAIVGSDAPTDTASSIRVTLDKIDGRWLISGFDPI
jgi:Mce-associated membrane protein